jgi:hypothetical protein
MCVSGLYEDNLNTVVANNEGFTVNRNKIPQCKKIEKNLCKTKTLDFTTPPVLQRNETCFAEKEKRKKRRKKNPKLLQMSL